MSQETLLANESIYIVSIILAEDKITQEIEKFEGALTQADYSIVYYETNKLLSQSQFSESYKLTNDTDISQTLANAIEWTLSKHITKYRIKATEDVINCFKVACMKFKDVAPKDELLKAFRNETQRLFAEHLANVALAQQ